MRGNKPPVTPPGKQLCSRCCVNKPVGDFVNAYGFAMKTCSRCRMRKPVPPRDGERYCSRCRGYKAAADFVNAEGMEMKCCNACRKRKSEQRAEIARIVAVTTGKVPVSATDALPGVPISEEETLCAACCIVQGDSEFDGESNICRSCWAWNPKIAKAVFTSTSAANETPTALPITGGEPVDEPPAPEVRPADRAVAESAAARRTKKLKDEHADLIDRLNEAVARAEFVESLRESYVPIILPREVNSGLREGALVAMASDWHVEETVEAEKVAFKNRYDLSIAEARAKRFFSGTRWLLEHHRQAFTMRDMVLWGGGDLITGNIHRELLETNSLSPTQAVLFLKRIFSDGMATILADPLIERLVVVWSNGNHDRYTEKRQIKTAAENSFSWLLGNVLRDEWASRDPRVEFVVDRSAHQYAEVYGRTLHFTHGDELKYGGGVGGIGIPLLKRVPVWDRLRASDIHHIGHFHQFRDFGRALVNGSLIGTTEYSVSIGADLEPPQQGSYVLDAKRGKCMVTPIWVDEDEGPAGTEAAEPDAPRARSVTA